MVFPAHAVEGVVDRLDGKREAGSRKFADGLIEKFADEDSEARLRWALTPSTVQHIVCTYFHIIFSSAWETVLYQEPLMARI